MIEIIITDPSKKGDIMYNNEYLIFSAKVESIKDDFIVENGFNIYQDGELLERLPLEKD